MNDFEHSTNGIDERRQHHGSDTRHRPVGPNLAVLAIIHGVLTGLGLILGFAIAGGHRYPSPLGPLADVMDYFQHFPLAAQVTALLFFGSAVPLLIFTATAYARLRRLGVRVPGAVICLAGGIWASSFLALSGLLLWTLSQVAATASAELIHALALAVYITGGVGFATGAGLLVAGLAVPSLILRFVPRWLAAVGLIIALCGELSFFSMVAPPMAILLPVVRFAIIPWLIITAILLPRRRKAANRR